MVSSLFLLAYFSLIPWSLCLSGSYKIASLAIDSANVVFLLLVQLAFPLVAWLGNFESKTTTFSLLFDSLILVNLFALFCMANVLLFFLLFELLVVVLFVLLLLFLHSYYWIRTSFFFFYYSLAGSLSFVLAIALWTTFASCLLVTLVIIPLLVKLPAFPFFYWLPEVHSESNSSISLLLAGLILKLSIYGLIRFTLSTFYLPLQFFLPVLLSCTLFGLLIVACSCFRYFDLKKIIAFSSILHLNLSFASLLSFNSCGLLSGIFISLSHSFSSVGLFLLAGLVINKTYSRYLDSIFMLDFALRLLFALFVLANLNIPGSANFLGELLSLVAAFSIGTFYAAFFLLTSFISSLLWFLILNRKLACCCSYSLCVNPLLVLN